MDKSKKKNDELLRKLQTKLRKQRQELLRSHEFELKQKLKAQSEKYEKEIGALKNKLKSTIGVTKLKQKKELNALRDELESNHQEEIIKKEYEINDMRESSQSQKDQFDEINDSLNAQNEKLKQEITDLNDEAGNTHNDITEWISQQKSKQIEDASKKDLFRFIFVQFLSIFHLFLINDSNKIESKLSDINAKAKEFIESRVKEWKATNEELDSVIIELDDKRQLLNDVQTEIDILRDELNEKSTKLERIQDNYHDDLHRDTNEYKLAMQQMQQNFESEILNRERIEAELSDAIQANSQFQKCNSELDVKGNHYQQITNELQQKLNHNEQLCEQYKEHIMSLQLELEKMALAKQDVNRQLARKSDECVEFKTKYAMGQSKHRKQMGAVEDQLQSTLDELKKKTKECSGLKERLHIPSPQNKLKKKSPKRRK